MVRLFFSLLFIIGLVLGSEGMPVIDALPDYALARVDIPAPVSPMVPLLPVQLVVAVLDKDAQPVESIIDGDQVSLLARLPERASAPLQITFRLVDGPKEGAELWLGTCTVLPGGLGCRSEAMRAWGWYWANDGAPQPTRRVTAMTEPLLFLSGEDSLLSGSTTIQVTPRPVVFVHGFSSSFKAWANYLGPQGYLAADGLSGYAVGDGQFEGVMNTGSIVDPATPTNTIAENAAILGEYIAQVKAATGAQAVDLVAHSMGGLISRYYIGRVMGVRDVAQLVMLGSPMAGTDCSNLPAALGFYLPAVLEIRPNYVQEIFNTQVGERKGVPFHALAGVSIQNPVGSPCTSAPSDAVVSLQSVSAIPLQVEEMPLLHTDLNTSREVYSGYLLPLLQTPAGNFPTQPELPALGSAPGRLQFTHVITGHVGPGQADSLTIEIDTGVTVAGFALYDPTRSITVTVQGASGNVILLDPVTNGVVVIDDPETLLTLGYGFENPRPGPWVVTLGATGSTPPEGADYAIMAHLQGGAALTAEASTILPNAGETVVFSAEMQAGGQPVAIREATALIRGPDGLVEELDLILDGERHSLTWAPTQPGLYAIDIRASSQGHDGALLERAAFLSVEAQPVLQPVRIYAILLALGVALAGVVVLGGLVLMLVVLRRRLK